MIELYEAEWEEKRQADSNAVLLDVRTEEEFQDKHLPNAKLLDIRQPNSFMAAAQDLDKDKTYFIYCRSGARSAQACQLLDQLGVLATYNLKGGILDWTGEVNT
ncbi:MAG: rhodanese-like domain-containing protein [Flavobacteriaceae bacterium]